MKKSFTLIMSCPQVLIFSKYFDRKKKIIVQTALHLYQAEIMNTLIFTNNINTKVVYNGEKQYDSLRVQILKYPSCFLNLN